MPARRPALLDILACAIIAYLGSGYVRESSLDQIADRFVALHSGYAVDELGNRPAAAALGTDVVAAISLAAAMMAFAVCIHLVPTLIHLLICSEFKRRVNREAFCFETYLVLWTFTVLVLAVVCKGRLSLTCWMWFTAGYAFIRASNRPESLREQIATYTAFPGGAAPPDAPANRWRSLIVLAFLVVFFNAAVRGPEVNSFFTGLVETPVDGSIIKLLTLLVAWSVAAFVGPLITIVILQHLPLLRGAVRELSFLLTLVLFCDVKRRQGTLLSGLGTLVVVTMVSLLIVSFAGPGRAGVYAGVTFLLYLTTWPLCQRHVMEDYIQRFLPVAGIPRPGIVQSTES